MFKAITWGQFTGVVLVLLLLYYAYVGLVYYRVELMGLLKGRGKAAGPAPTPATAPSPAGAALIGRGSLISKPAATPAAAPAEVATPSTAPASPTEPDETDQEEAPAEPETTEELITDELPDFALTAVDTLENNVEAVNQDAPDVDIKYNFTQQEGSDSLPSAGGDPGTDSEDSEPGFTIGIAQLGNYLERAAEGQITQQELVEQEPGLADTDLLVAFFQSSTKEAQRATSHLYADVAEPSLG